MTPTPCDGRTELAKRIIACLDVRENDAGDLVVTKGDQYDVREKSEGAEVSIVCKFVELARPYLYICMCVCMSSMYVCIIRIYVCMYIHTYIRVYIYIYIRMYVCTCVCVYIYI
jgi:hypothetical protein